MKLLIFGTNGMLGHKLYQEFAGKFDVTGTIRGDFATVERFGIFDRTKILEFVDASSAESVESAIRSAEPDVVINSIGIIKQVPDASNVITSLTVNSIFPHRLSELGQKYGFRLISISTDCVFDGVRGNYSEDDVPNAADLYGKSKNLGEVTGPNCLTIRTSIIGRELETRHSLLEWVLSNRGKTIRGYTNAIYSGFPTIVFADILSCLITDHKDLSGLFHVASTPISKFALLNLINTYYGADIEIVPFGEFSIDRSLNAAKFNEKTGFRPTDWEEMVREMASDPTPYEKWKR